MQLWRNSFSNTSFRRELFNELDIILFYMVLNESISNMLQFSNRIDYFRRFNPEKHNFVDTFIFKCQTLYAKFA